MSVVLAQVWYKVSLIAEIGLNGILLFIMKVLVIILIEEQESKYTVVCFLPYILFLQSYLS